MASMGFAGVLLAASSSALSQEVSIDRGKALADQNCGRCHATGASGAGNHPEAPPFRDLSKRYPVDHLAESLAEGIMTGHPDMPVIEFEADQVEDFLAYLRAIQSQ